MINKRSKKTVIWLLISVLGMFGFGYALVPLYKVFCSVTGLNGRIYSAAEVQSVVSIDESRMITVQFIATNNEGLPWDFYPNVRSIKIHPGQVTRISFYAKNNSSEKMTVQAIPSVTPGLATKYLHKTECFCFTQQALESGAQMDMPILFHLDREIPENINTVTISYTLFDTKLVNTNVQKVGKIS